MPHRHRSLLYCEWQIDPEITLCPHIQSNGTEIVFRMRFIALCSLYIYILSSYHHVSFRLILMLLLLPLLYAV